MGRRHALGPRALRRFRRRPVPAGEDPTAERRPRQQRETVAQRQRHEFVLDAPVEQVVRRLLADVSGPAALVAHAEAFLHVPRRMRRTADVEHLAAAHEVIERGQRLLGIDVEERSVQLVEVDAVGA